MIRVFCGSEAKTEVPARVLERSIKARTQADVEFTVMGDYKPWIVPKVVHQATGFSLRRWMIPEACNYQGRAIYLDADQLVLADIRELWDFGDGDGAVFCTFRPDKCSAMLTGHGKSPVPQTSVMVVNCDQCHPAQWDRHRIFNVIRKHGKPHSGKAVVKAYQKLMHGGLVDRSRVVEIPRTWNEFNEWHETSKLLHYTFETQQPWYQPWHPLCHLWEAELEAAILEGYVTEEVFEDGLSRWHSGSNDWRKYGGLNPYWEKMRPLFGKAA